VNPGSLPFNKRDNFPRDTGIVLKVASFSSRYRLRSPNKDFFIRVKSAVMLLSLVSHVRLKVYSPIQSDLPIFDGTGIIIKNRIFGSSRLFPRLFIVLMYFAVDILT
jgi:hypothetical protein